MDGDIHGMWICGEDKGKLKLIKVKSDKGGPQTLTVQFLSLYFIDYAITVVPIFPTLSPSNQHPYSFRQASHH